MTPDTKHLILGSSYLLSKVSFTLSLCCFSEIIEFLLTPHNLLEKKKTILCSLSFVNKCLWQGDGNLKTHQPTPKNLQMTVQIHKVYKVCHLTMLPSFSHLLTTCRVPFKMGFILLTFTGTSLTLISTRYICLYCTDATEKSKSHPLVLRLLS